jgi:hypothetical protein
MRAATKSRKEFSLLFNGNFMAMQKTLIMGIKVMIIKLVTVRGNFWHVEEIQL